MVALLVLLIFATMVGGILWQNERNSRGVLALARDLASANRDSLIAACERGNVLRRGVNQRGEVLLEFTQAAALAREELAELATDPKVAASNASAAGRYRALGERIELIPLVDCVVTIPPLVVGKG